ncbi:hypothetical protein [Shewanella psychrophila]|uniref:hypothetical protein n=1 Tax=Shewanella psychrophila TaxID=225848 RepID=UPI00098B1848|nr:hypothetical protein [Shewanella psychrophila]
MYKLTRLLTTIALTASLSWLAPSAYAVDSFFDVFFDIEVTSSPSSPLDSDKGRILTFID